MELQCWANAQCSWRESVEVGIQSPHIQNCKIAVEIEVKNNDRDTESCHRVDSQSRSMVKWLNSVTGKTPNS